MQLKYSGDLVKLDLQLLKNEILNNNLTDDQKITINQNYMDYINSLSFEGFIYLMGNEIYVDKRVMKFVGQQYAENSK